MMIMNEPVEIENMQELFHHHLYQIPKSSVIQSKSKREREKKQQMIDDDDVYYNDHDHFREIPSVDLF